MELSRSVQGSRAVVTGAASGIGLATVALLAQQGARVGALDRPGSALEESVVKLPESANVESRLVDVVDDAGVRAAITDLAEVFGGLDIVINCAGVSLPAAIGDEDAWEKTMQVNLHGVHRVVRASLPYLEQSDAARIVNVASTEALGAQPFVSAYTASKHGVLGLTRALAVELGRKGITANAICPGPIHTGMTANIPDEAKAKFARRRVPLGRYGHPEEVAHAILGLVLPSSSFITGACLSVDGGMAIQN